MAIIWLGHSQSTSHDKSHHFSGSSFCITSLRDGRSPPICTSFTTRDNRNDKSCAVTAFHQPLTSTAFHPRALGGGCCSLQRDLQGAHLPVSAGSIPNLGPVAAKTIRILLLNLYVFVIFPVLKMASPPA